MQIIMENITIVNYMVIMIKKKIYKNKQMKIMRNNQKVRNIQKVRDSNNKRDMYEKYKTSCNS